MFFRLLLAVSCLIFVSADYAKAEAVEEHVEWCVTSDSANSTIEEQARPWPREYCKAIYAGKMFFGLPLDGKQRDWGRRAVGHACSADYNNQAAAIGLIAACQCHRNDATEQVMRERVSVIHRLRKFGNCDDLGLPIY
ncbi:hypothetical protein ACQR10_04520 [Bradyrhizobium sp. HKCCYLRH2060]|uniref:hypothetical protein n=1 Tax=Bradyrhizobium sp. HKCCYLRH2060 TaxID=3420743 RepID=UPI003EBFA20C